MNRSGALRESFNRLKCCVIVPTYNNSKTLAEILNGILEYTNHIIVVNDGSTDQTAQILENFSAIQIISYSPNKGKGHALRTAFTKAVESGYEYAISIDSDGQHDPADLSVFIEKLKTEPDSLIVGVRNMEQTGIPAKSTFGLKFSNFWFWLETTKKIKDTQSGFRCYPIKKLQEISFFTEKFEFEIEVLVRATWKSIRILEVPVKVFYADKSERISHFRPFKDFFRISILNSVLVLLAVLYYLPLKFLKGFTWKNLKEFVKTNVLYSKESNLKITFSVMLGVFSSIIPIWGWQLIMALTLAYLLRLNKIIVVASSNLSIPPMMPLILYLSYITGGFVMGSKMNLKFDSSLSLTFFKANLLQYVIGSLVFATIASVFSGLLTFTLLKIFREKRLNL